MVLELVGTGVAASTDVARKRAASCPAAASRRRHLGVSSPDVTVVCRVRRKRLPTMLALDIGNSAIQAY